MFKSLGFQIEALLAEFVRDGADNGHEPVLLSHLAESNWSALAGPELAKLAE